MRRIAVAAACLLFAFTGCSDVAEPERALPEILVALDGDEQEGIVGGGIERPLVVQVTDSSGTEIPGVSVIWSTTGGSLGAATTTTDAFGIAAVNWTLGPTAGEQAVQASVSGVAPVTFTAIAAPGAVAQVEIAEDTLAFIVGDAHPFAASAEDAFGNAVTEPGFVWMSLDSAVAAIDSVTGQFVAVGSGTARITAEVGTVVDTVEVTVQDPETVLPVAWYRTYPMTGQDLRDIWAASAGAIFAVGGGAGVTVADEVAGGVILFFDGTYWTRMVVDAETPTLNSVWGTSATDVFAVGHEGVILHWNGTAWTRMAGPTTQELSGVWGTSSTNVYAVGHDGGIFHYDGTDWNVVFSGSLVELHDVWASSATDVFVVGDGGVIRHWDGTAWSSMDTPVLSDLYGVWGSSATNVYAVGAGGTVLRYDGTAWAELTGVGATGTLHTVTGISDSRVMIAGTGAWRFDGSAWTAMVHTLNPFFYGATVDATGAIHAAGTAGSIFRNASADAWQITHSTAEVRDVWAVSENLAFRVGAHGTILRFDGTGWVAMESPTTANLESVWAHDGQSVYAVGGEVVLYYDGTTWGERALDLTGTFSGIHGRSLTDVYVAGSDGVARYNGDTWTVVDPAMKGAVFVDAQSGEVHATGGFTARHWNGTEWVDVTNATSESFALDLWGDSPAYMLACLASQAVGHYDGEHWQRNELPELCRDVHGLSRYDLFVVGSAGEIHHRSGTGLGWTSLTPVGFTATLNSVFATQPRIFVGGQSGVILHGDR